MSTADINAINQALGNIQSSFNTITGDSLSSYNQINNIVSQQTNIFNSIYNGLGGLKTGNLNTYSMSLSGGNVLYNAPFKIVSGQFTSPSIGNTNYNNFVVTFDMPFSAPPYIVLGTPTSAPFTFGVSLITATTFSAYGRNTSASTLSSTVNYIAIGPL